MALQKALSKKKKYYFQEKIEENANDSKELWKVLKSLGIKFNNNSMKQYYMTIEKSCLNFELCNATMESIKKILTSLDTSKGPGLDGISSKLLKDGPEILALPQCNLVNLSVKESLFPGQCKIANLKPLFKKYSNSNPRNYRSNSLLPVRSEIIEKTIHIKTKEYFDKSGLFFKYQ